MVRFIFISETLLKAIVLPILALLLSSGQPALADPSTTHLEEKIQREQSQKKAVQERISEAEKKIIDLGAHETSVVQELERLNLQLHSSQVRLRETRTEIQRLEDQMASLEAEQKSLATQIQTLEAFAVPRLVAFYKLGQLGIAPMLFSAESFSRLWQRREALEQILQHDTDLWDSLKDRKRRLEVVSRDLETKKLNQQNLLAKGKEQGTRISQQRADRAKLLETIQTDKNLTLASIASLEESAKRLDETIRLLEQQLRSPSPGSGAKPSLFAKLRGSLPMPVQGEIVGPFGPYVHAGDYRIKGHRSGVTIKARADAQVRAVCDGRVIYAGWFKGYGNIMIIDHGDHYYTLSAPLEELLRDKGDVVLGGEVIGTYGDMATLSGPGLYFEVRHYGEPLDPVSWFKK
jgi:septal ring factor EnvC (AmiA/AmiB activator)